jgi:hypothetical protein
MTAPHLPEHPLLAADDYPLHQVAETFVRVGGQHPKFTDRWYFNLQDLDGRMRGIVGGGFYPVAGVLEVYACVLVDGTQVNVRQRVRCFDRQRLDAAPAVGFQVIEPLQRWSARVDGPDLAMELDFAAAHPPYLFPPFFVAADPPHQASPREVDAIQHFVQPGRASGSISTASGTHALDGVSFRDRTWGVRSSRPRLHQWFVLHLDDGSFLTLIHQERADGDRLVSHVARVTADGLVDRGVPDGHDLTIDRASRLLLEGRFTGHDRSGAPLEVHVTNAGEGVRLLGAGYTADQGDEALLGSVTGETWDLADPAEAVRLGRGTIDSPVTATARWGDWSAAGIGVTETAVARNHWRYGAQLSTPPQEET